MSTASVDELLERVRSTRKLPKPEERRRIRKAAISDSGVRDAQGRADVAQCEPWELNASPREPRRSEYARLLAELRSLATDKGARL